ncbi:MAG: hypothetical protein ABI560_00810 [Myxococcales bacterium]
MATGSGPVLRIIDSRTTEPPAARYAARIRWRRVGRPDWEIDTRHPGFENWRQAACFANGLIEEGACALFLYEGVLLLQLVNGRDVIVEAHDAVIWHRANPNDGGVPEDAAFIRAGLDLDEISRAGLDGAFSPIRFGVDDLHAFNQLDVRVEADTRRRAVVVTLATPQKGDEAKIDMVGGAFFDVPQA